MNELDLHDALTEIDESFIKEADQVLTSVPVCGETDAEQKPQGRRVHRRIVRIALIAACLVVLLVGTVYATTEAFRGETFLKLIGTNANEEDIASGYVAIEDTKQLEIEPVKIEDLIEGKNADKWEISKITLEDIIGDKNKVYVELSTDCKVDEPDGWFVNSGCPFKMDVEAEAIFSDDFEPLGHGTGLAPFIRDGRLWYFVIIAYNDVSTIMDIDLSHLPMRLRITGTTDKDSSIDLTFEWTNDYEAKSEVIPINKEVNGLLLTDIQFSLTSMDICFTSERELSQNEMKEPIPLEYIRLDDGTVLRYTKNNEKMPIKFFGHIQTFPGGSKGVSYFDLLCGFTEDGLFRLVPFERIQSICINGEEIRIR